MLLPILSVITDKQILMKVPHNVISCIKNALALLELVGIKSAVILGFLYQYYLDPEISDTFKAPSPMWQMN